MSKPSCLKYRHFFTARAIMSSIISWVISDTFSTGENHMGNGFSMEGWGWKLGISRGMR